jgi:tetratricopeptide (TPR) repeat protein
MKNLQSLASLIHSLNEFEIKTLKKFLAFYNERGGEKTIYIINEILLNKDISSNALKNRIYNSENRYSFDKLIARAKEKIYEIILFENNIIKNKYPDRVKITFQLKKKLIQCDVLSLKGLREDSDFLCRKIINKAEKYELYDIVMNANQIRQKFINIRKNANVVKLIQRKIELADAVNKSIIFSQGIYNSIINRMNNSTNYNEYFEDLTKTINALTNEYQNNHSNIIGYYLYFLKTELYQINENLEESRRCLNYLLEILKNKSIYTENRMGATLINIANNDLLLGNYKNALDNANRAIKYFPKNIYNQSIVNETLFYIYFYQKKYSDSKQTIESLVSISSPNISQGSKEKWKYLYASLLFSIKEYENCLLVLESIVEIDKDKEGWNINIRILRILTHIEMKQFETVDLEIINLEKYIKRLAKRKEMNPRYIYIIKILIKLANTNYDFRAVAKLRKTYLEIISSNDRLYKWKIKSPELIPFHLWFDKNIVA